MVSFLIIATIIHRWRMQFIMQIRNQLVNKFLARQHQLNQHLSTTHTTHPHRAVRSQLVLGPRFFPCGLCFVFDWVKCSYFLQLSWVVVRWPRPPLPTSLHNNIDQWQSQTPTKLNMRFSLPCWLSHHSVVAKESRVNTKRHEIMYHMTSADDK